MGKKNNGKKRRHQTQQAHDKNMSQDQSNSTQSIASPLPSKQDGNSSIQQAKLPGAEIPVRKPVYSRDKSKTPERRTTKPRAKSKTPERQANQLTSNGAVTLAEAASQISDGHINRDPLVHSHTDGLETHTSHVLVDQTENDNPETSVHVENHMDLDSSQQLPDHYKALEERGLSPQPDNTLKMYPIDFKAVQKIYMLGNQSKYNDWITENADNGKSRGRYTKTLSNGQTIDTDRLITNSIIDATNSPFMQLMLIIAAVCTVITLAAIAEQSLVTLTVPTACLMMFFYFLSTLSRFLRELDLDELDLDLLAGSPGMFKLFEWILSTRIQYLDMSMLYISRTVVNYVTLRMIHFKQIFLSTLCILPDLLIQCSLDYISVLTLLFFNFLAVSELIDCILSPLTSLISRQVSTLIGWNTAFEHQANPIDALVYKHGFASYSLLGTIVDICKRSLSIIPLLMNSVIRIAEIIFRPFVHTFGLVCPESALRIHKCINHHALITENIFTARDKLKSGRSIEDTPDRVDWSLAFNKSM